VVIDDVNDDDGRDFRPVEATVVSQRPWISGLEDEPPGMIKVDRQLTEPRPLELVAPRCGQPSDVGKATGRAQLIQTPAKDSAGSFAEGSLPQFRVVADTLELL
jgi:hypothetical protein